MSKEDKILSALETLVIKVGNLEQGQAETNKRLDRLESDVGALKQDVSELKINLKLVSSLQMEDYNLLKALDKKVDKLSNVTSLHERRFIKMKEAI